MKRYLLLLLLCPMLTRAQSHDRHLNLVLDTVKSTYFDPRYKADVLEAFRIANQVLNSAEFQKEIKATSLDYNSYWERHQTPGRKGRISGEEVLARLYKEENVTLVMDLKESGKALGETKDRSYRTTAWYKNIIDNMPEFSFAQGLAVNLCHEYMHQVGFRHLYCTGPWPVCAGKNKLREPNGGKDPDPKFYNEDVTYRIGWTAYNILKNKLRH